MTNSLRASVAGLAIVDKARQRRGWTKSSTARWWQEAHTSRATLRRFWQGDRIQRDIFIALCEAVGVSQWEQIADRESAFIDPMDQPCSEAPELPSTTFYDLDEAPNVEAFYGRSQELNRLTTWVVSEQCKLLTILGMGGIGKTALALALVDQLGGTPPFERILWRSLQTAPTLLQLLDSILHTFSTQPTMDIIETAQQGISQLLQHLREQRCLLILDGWEAILANQNTYRVDYQAYGNFLSRLSRDRHQSCILVTSQEKPPEFTDDGKRVRSLTLRGLTTTAALELLQNQSFQGKERGLSALIRLYGGNPLALKVTAPLIQTVFGGNVLTYLSQNTVAIGNHLRTVLKQQLDRLSPLERAIVYWLAIWQEPIAFCRLQSQLLDTSDPAATLESLASLEGRSLLEKCFHHADPLFTLQPFVMKIVRDELMKQAVQELYQAMRSNDISHFQIIRTHGLLRPGTDNIAGDLILTQLSDNLEALVGGELLQSLGRLFPLLQDLSPFTVGYAIHNLDALIRLLT